MQLLKPKNKAYRDIDRPYGRTTREIANSLYLKEGKVRRAIRDLVRKKDYDLK